MPFKGISYLELRQRCSAERNHLCNFCRGYNEEQFREIILNLRQWFRKKCRLKDLLSRSLAALLFDGANHLCNFERGHQWKHSCEVI